MSEPLNNLLAALSAADCRPQFFIMLKALRDIKALHDCKEIRGLAWDIGVPRQDVKPGGWVPIPPEVRVGLQYAARIAAKALDELASLNDNFSGKDGG
jgi:hypothetical protein